MVLSKKQEEFLDILLEWIDSHEIKRVIFNLVSGELQRLIERNNLDNKIERVSLLTEILDNEIEAFHNNISESITTEVLNGIRSHIEVNRKYNLVKGSLFAYMDNLSKAKQHLESQYLKYIPTSITLDAEIENRKLIKSTEELISILDEWIDELIQSQSYPQYKLLAIQDKYAKYKDEFDCYKTICSTCVLAQYANNPAEAKVFLTEIFTRRQEEFYSLLEHWAKDEIQDKGCSQWLSLYLSKGRDMRIGKIGVLRYIDNLPKAKEFLLEKYNQKQERAILKKQEYENKRKSIFDNYEIIGSVNRLLPELSQDKLFSTCISSNDSGKISPLSLMSSKEGFVIKKDCIKVGIVAHHLTLKAANPLFYSYTSTYRKRTCFFTLLTPVALDIVKRYSSMHLDRNLVDKTQACIIVRDVDDKKRHKCYMCFLTSDKDLYDAVPKFIYDFSAAKTSNYHDKAGYRYVFKALLWHLLKDKSDSIDFSPKRDFTGKERKLIFQLIEKHYCEMSYEDKYICHFINNSYVFPKDPSTSSMRQRRYFEDRILNLSNCVTNQYDTQVLEDRFFQFLKIRYQYGDTTFIDLTSSIGNKVKNEDFIGVWFDNSKSSFLQNLRSLLFINWVYIGNKYVSVKWISACWLLTIVLRQYKCSYERDKGFWTLLLAYILIENEIIYTTLIQKLFDNPDFSVNKISIATVVKSLLSNKKDLYKRLFSYQKSFLSNNIYKSTFYDDYLKGRDSNFVTLEQAISLLDDLCVAMNIQPHDYINSNLHVYLANTIKYKVPDNFIYHPCKHSHSHTYNNYRGTYAYDIAGYTASEIDILFEGDPNAYWNID